LIESKDSADKEFQEMKKAENERNKALKDSQIESAMLRERYHEVAVSHKELEKMLSNEVASKGSAETRMTSNDEVVDSLRKEKNSLHLKLDATVLRMNQCDQELSHAAQQLSALSQEVARANQIKEQMLTADAEVGVLKGDISRLLRLMDHYPASKTFLDRWYDSDGMSFMGMGEPKGMPKESAALRRNNKGIDYTVLGIEDEGEFEEFREEVTDGFGDITPGEFANLKRLYGGDPFPMTANFEDEAELWVPRKAAHAGLQFLAQKIPHAPPKLITEFLRKINKVWLRREARKTGDLKAFYDGQISDLKRQLANLKPYRGVIAETHIRRLKSQVQSEHNKQLKGRSKKTLEASDNYFDDYDDNDSINETHTVRGRLCEQTLSKKGGGSVVTVSKAKLLEASLLSLETLGRQRYTGAPDGDSGFPQGSNAHPSEAYLRGALWLGRNLAMVIEELAEGLDYFRSKHLTEVATASSDLDLKRSRHRLNLLALSSINEAFALTNKSRIRARDILQGTASLSNGDLSTFQEFLRTLPIESSLQPPIPQTGTGGNVSRGGAKSNMFNTNSSIYSSARKSNINNISKASY